MECTLWVGICFVFCALAYGSSSAAVSEGLKYFTPEMVITFRMFFGCCFCLLVMICRIIWQPGYKQIWRAHFTSGGWPIFHVAIGGLLNLGIPHSLIAIAQQWIPSAAVQLAKPLIPAASAIFGQCFPINEPFTRNKLYALITAIIGVSLSATPSFLHTNAKATINNVIIGYILLISSMGVLGLAAVYFRWKTPNMDITVSSFLQTGFSSIFCFVWSMIMDGKDKFIHICKTATPYGWLWPVLLGVVASGIAVHGFMYIVEKLGAVGSGFIPFGQIVVGVTIGVFALNEWKGYSLWEIMLQIVGIVFLSSAILIGFLHEKEEETEKHPEEEAHPEEESSASLIEI